VIAVGGGTRNRVWSQAVSDVTGEPQTLRRHSTGAAYGSAFLAAVAVGDVRREAIRDWNPAEGGVTPDPATAGTYSRLFSIYKRLYAQTRDLMEEIGG
jgi:xylulokinase